MDPQQRRTHRVTMTLTGTVPKVLPAKVRAQHGRFHEHALRVPADTAVILSMLVIALQAGAIVVGLIVIAALVASFFFA